MVGNDRILQLLERHRGDLDTAAKALVAAANKGGGEDNITVVAFEIAGAEDETLLEPAVTAERTPDEEDTLTEVDRVPAVTTMVIPPEEAAAFAEPEPEERSAPPRPPRKVLALLVLILLAIAATIVVYFLAR